jgi:hypothetical protein
MARKKKTSRARKSKGAARAVCFVIMPFGGWFDDYYESIYCPAISAAGLEPHRADDLYRPSTIVQDIWTYTKQAQLILADLTGKNPNVFYELGLAHGIARPAILVSESLDDIPFDLRALRVIEYNKNASNWGEVLQDKIEAAIKEVLRSPLEAVLPAFLSVKGGAAKTTVTPHEKDLLEVKKDLDLLKAEMQRRRMFEDRQRRHLPREEAEARLQHYLRTGMPASEIIERLAALGAPASWVERELEARRPSARPAAAAPVSPTPGEVGETKEKPKDIEKK